jgi:hypothetical protein
MTAPALDPASRRSWGWAEHLGTGLTVGYLALVVIGMFHTFALYFRFGINILEFAEPSDFLLAPVRDPLVMVITVVPVLLVWWYMVASWAWSERVRVRRRDEGKPIAWWETKEENVDSMRRVMVWLRIPTAVLWVFAIGLGYQRRAADAIMLGNGRRVAVETTNGAVERGTEKRPLMLIGTTSRYLFLFRTEEWKTVILPVENVLRIAPEGLARGRITTRGRFLKAMDSTS